MLAPYRWPDRCDLFAYLASPDAMSRLAAIFSRSCHSEMVSVGMHLFLTHWQRAARHGGLVGFRHGLPIVGMD